MRVNKKTKNSKIVIVGAGPTGCYLGQLLKAKGFELLLIEEHKEIGRPVHCAGLVGEKVFKEARIPLSTKCILNTIHGATIYLGQEAFTLRKGKVAYVVDREIFDKNLGKGLDILFETKFLGLEKENGQYVIETDRGEMLADIVVGADGANSLVREFVEENLPSLHLKGVQFRMAAKPKNSDLVEVHLEKPYFYWIIPESDKIVRVGVISENPYHDLLNFVEKNKIEGEIIEKFAGVVPLNYYKKLSRERIFLVGDSVAQIKPLTYGGIYMGMRGAEVLADCLVHGRLSRYSSLWQKSFGRENRISLRARKMFQELANEDLKRIFSFLKNNKKVIEKKADFERHSGLLQDLLRSPKNSKELTAILFKIFRDNLPKGLFDKSH